MKASAEDFIAIIQEWAGRELAVLAAQYGASRLSLAELTAGIDDVGARAGQLVETFYAIAREPQERQDRSLLT